MFDPDKCFKVKAQGTLPYGRLTPAMFALRLSVLKNGSSNLIEWLIPKIARATWICITDKLDELRAGMGELKNRGGQ